MHVCLPPLALGFGDVMTFFKDGGVFMWALLITSIVSLTVIILKAMTLRRSLIVPQRLEHEVQNFEERLDKGTVDALAREFRSGSSSLGRLCAVALDNVERSQGEMQEAVQASAREEVVKMNTGMSILEVVITIAPLLGLLGTASGLVIVFRDLSGDQEEVSRGIALALQTTIAGLAISVPSVIAHSYFNRLIETMAVRLEVLMGKMVSACHQHIFFQDK